jgi:hypothetical protein
MASLLRLHSGSVFNGNPIVFIVWPIALKETPSFHRMIFEVKCRMSGMSDGKYETIKMSEPINNEKGNPITVDISSALRSFRDSYEYSPEPGVMPVVKFNVSAYDEYMTNGELHKSEPVSYLAGEDVKQTLFGGFSDYDRLMATNDTMPVSRMTRKPTTIPQLACVGETIIYVEPYSPAVDFTTATWEAPEAKAYKITAEGAQTVGGQQLFALPASEAARRTEFRFINSFGVLESVSVPRVYSKKLGITTTNYTVTRKETLRSFSRATVRKQGNMEGWNYMTDPLDEKWLAWYLHELLMSEHAWININGKFLPCTITADEEISFDDKTKETMHSVSFTAKLDFHGSTII